MTSLRPYQQAAIDAVLSYWADGGENPLIEMATGTGKSVVISTLTRDLLIRWPDMRVIMLVHVKELVEQNARAMLRTWPQVPIGINSAGLGRRDMRAQVLCASIQSVYRAGRELGPRDLILVDEAHLVPREGEGMYRRLLDDLRETVPDLRVAGFTATPYRLDSGRLDKGDGRLFSEIVYTYGIAEGIRDGFLSSLISKATATTLDVSDVARRGGEFIPGALEVAIDKDWITREAVSEMVQLGADRRSWLVFCAGVKHAAHVRDEIRSRGISCETITGETSHGERDRIIRDFREGRIRALTNAQVLTTGFDAPSVDMVAMLRPTLSTGLYVQIVGRGTRIAPSKANCLILDYAGNVRRHGPVDAIEISSGSAKGDGAVKEGDVRAKTCPECQTLLALNARSCFVCGHEYPVEDKPKHEAKADAEVSILSTAAPAWVPVSDWRWYRHVKPGSPPSLRVEYECGISVHREWICLEHPGFAGEKARRWWGKMVGGEVPTTVDQAVLRKGDPPEAIMVRPDGKYFQVVGHRTARAAA